MFNLRVIVFAFISLVGLWLGQSHANSLDTHSIRSQTPQDFLSSSPAQQENLEQVSSAELSDDDPEVEFTVPFNTNAKISSFDDYPFIGLSQHYHASESERGPPFKS